MIKKKKIKIMNVYIKSAQLPNYFSKEYSCLRTCVINGIVIASKL